MKTLYIECNMGAAGDMLTAALLELVEDKEKTIGELNGLGIPDVVYQTQPAVKCGITGTSVQVMIHGQEESTEDVSYHKHEHSYRHSHSHEHSHEHDTSHHHEHSHEHGYEEFDHDHSHGHTHTHDHEHIHDHDKTHDHSHSHDHDHSHSHVHRSMADVSKIIDSLSLTDKVSSQVKEVYGLIAEAESKAHGKPVDQIHFHEVGSMDAIADVTAVSYLIDKIHPDKITVSPIHVGSGHVHCAHGIMPVPAPATVHILQGVPTYGGKIQGELCTPTGAALLKYYASDFGSMPPISVSRIGYGMGKKDFEAANCVRVFLGESVEDDSYTDTSIELNCNVDDMTGEEVGFALEKLMALGARDAFAQSVIMKKSRPGILITVICSPQDKDTMVKALFRYTKTIGIRETQHPRYILHRTLETVNTDLGPIRKKISSGYGVEKFKYEYEDLVRISEKEQISLQEVLSRLS